MFGHFGHFGHLSLVWSPSLARLVDTMPCEVVPCRRAKGANALPPLPPRNKMNKRPHAADHTATEMAWIPPSRSTSLSRSQRCLPCLGHMPNTWGRVSSAPPSGCFHHSASNSAGLRDGPVGPHPPRLKMPRLNEIRRVGTNCSAPGALAGGMAAVWNAGGGGGAGHLVSCSPRDALPRCYSAVRVGQFVRSVYGWM